MIYLYAFFIKKTFIKCSSELLHRKYRCRCFAGTDSWYCCTQHSNSLHTSLQLTAQCMPHCTVHGILTSHTNAYSLDTARHTHWTQHCNPVHTALQLIAHNTATHSTLHVILFGHWTVYSQHCNSLHTILTACHSHYTHHGILEITAHIPAAHCTLLVLLTAHSTAIHCTQHCILSAQVTATHCTLDVILTMHSTAT